MTNGFLETAVRAARAAGDIIKQDFGKPMDIAFKDRVNPVTETDLKAERAILTIVNEAFPTHAVMAEESAQAESEAEYLWIADPMDGTTNFTHGYPCVAVSIALYHNNKPLVGVVFNPLHDELFAAERGKGSSLNGSPLHVSATDSLERSLLCTGFPYRLREEPADVFPVFEKISLLAQGIRRDGSAAIDICYVAAGRFDGFWERGLRPWDTAAGLLILEEAGGRATDYSGNAFHPFLKEVVVSNGLIHDELLRAMSQSVSFTTKGTKDMKDS
jgi:myo-inositol-1(or 4)-monophosphatase